MTLNQSALLELTEAMRTADDSKLMRTLLHTILQALVDAEATEHIGAGMHEQNDTRITQRNKTRTKVVSTTSGDLSVKIAKTRTGSFFPTLLHPRRDETVRDARKPQFLPSGHGVLLGEDFGHRS